MQRRSKPRSRKRPACGGNARPLNHYLYLMIRQLHAADVPAYRAIRLAALRSEPQAFCATYQAESEKPELFMERCLKTGDAANMMFGAFAGKELVGIAGFVKQQAEMIQVYTDKNHRGRGIGKQLLAALLNEAFGRFADLEAINIAVILTANNALKLYQSLGLKVTGNKPQRLMRAAMRTISLI